MEASTAATMKATAASTMKATAASAKWPPPPPR